MNLKPVLQKTQCQFDHSCSSWYPGINKELKNKLRAAQNSIRFIFLILQKGPYW